MVQIRWEGFGGNLVQLQSQLDCLLEGASGRAVLLMDSAGRLLTLVGDPPKFDLTTFVSLMAADFCATRELARLLGEEAFHTAFHQGDDYALYLTQVTEGTILALVFDHETTLGLVRFAVRQALPGLTRTIRQGYEDAAYAPSIEDGFEDETMDRINQLFDSPGHA
jgi:predicted regulator of Ras-like GTPase activity (Roadblock/LC7/MglB family)